MRARLRAVAGVVIAVVSLVSALGTLLQQIREIRKEQASLYENAAYSFSEDGAEVARLRARVDDLERIVRKKMPAEAAPTVGP